VLKKQPVVGHMGCFSSRKNIDDMNQGNEAMDHSTTATIPHTFSSSAAMRSLGAASHPAAAMRRAISAGLQCWLAGSGCA
jgi:hypothetical protein